MFQRSRIRSKKSGAGASRIRSRSCYRIQELLIPHFIGSFCWTRAPVKPISSVLQDLLSIKTCSNRSTCDKRSTCNSRSNSNTRSFCNNRNAELSCFWFWSFRSFWCGAPVLNYRIWSCFVGPLDSNSGTGVGTGFLALLQPRFQLQLITFGTSGTGSRGGVFS